MSDARDGDGVLLTVRTSKTNQEGDAADVRYLKNGAANAIRTLRAADADAAPTDRVIGLSPLQIQRRFTAAARAAGIEARVTAHSGRVGLASELTARGASTTEVMLAGNWKTARMVRPPATLGQTHSASRCLVHRSRLRTIRQHKNLPTCATAPKPAMRMRSSPLGSFTPRAKASRRMMSKPAGGTTSPTPGLPSQLMTSARRSCWRTAPLPSG